MQRMALRLPLFICVAVWLVFQTSQVLAGEVYPIEEVESIWGPRPEDKKSDSVSDEFETYSNDYSFVFNDGSNCKAERARKGNKEDLVWFDDCIVKQFQFKKSKDELRWLKQGYFGRKHDGLGSKTFEIAFKRAEGFFLANKDWSQTKNDFSCKELLTITAARYLLVTYALWKGHNGKLGPCEEYDDQKSRKITKIPKDDAAVCYPQPYGSATCTSDYDVGLIGKTAGSLIGKFNDYFTKKFSRASEKVFDTNIYAYNLEYAVPSKFQGLVNYNFVKLIKQAEDKVEFKMLELVNSYYKVFKYNEDFFNKLRDTAREVLHGKAPLAHLNKWDTLFRDSNTAVSIADPVDRKTHNNEYQKLMKSVSESGKNGGYSEPEKNLVTLSKAGLYAAEAYHTRGAIRHIVGGVQMKNEEYQPNKLCNMDLWVSMIENWGETNKEYKHTCNGKNVEVCVINISKYMWRVLTAMKCLYDRIKAKRNAIQNLDVPADPATPSQKIDAWYIAKKEKKDINIPQADITAFFQPFGCNANHATVGAVLHSDCMKAMNNQVDVYNKSLLKIFLHSRNMK